MGAMPRPSAAVPPDDHAAARARIRRLAHWLDGLVVIPGTRLKFGLDSLIGLIPGVGDVAGLLLGGGILAESLRLGAPNSLVARMAANVALDALVGAVPLLGDVFDFAFRAHARNARLLLEHLDARSPAGPPPAPARALLVALILLVLASLFGLAVYGLYSLLKLLF